MAKAKSKAPMSAAPMPSAPPVSKPAWASQSATRLGGRGAVGMSKPSPLKIVLGLVLVLIVVGSWQAYTFYEASVKPLVIPVASGSALTSDPAKVLAALKRVGQVKVPVTYAPLKALSLDVGGVLTTTVTLGPKALRTVAPGKTDTMPGQPNVNPESVTVIVLTRIKTHKGGTAPTGPMDDAKALVGAEVISTKDLKFAVGKKQVVAKMRQVKRNGKVLQIISVQPTSDVMIVATGPAKGVDRVALAALLKTFKPAHNASVNSKLAH